MRYWNWEAYRLPTSQHPRPLPALFSPLGKDYSVTPALLSTKSCRRNGPKPRGGVRSEPGTRFAYCSPAARQPTSTKGASGRLEPYAGGTRMSVERDAFRATLRVSRVCLERDYNTIFQSSPNLEGPTCGSTAADPLATWPHRH